MQGRSHDRKRNILSRPYCSIFFFQEIHSNVVLFQIELYCRIFSVMYYGRGVISELGHLAGLGFRVRIRNSFFLGADTVYWTFFH